MPREKTTKTGAAKEAPSPSADTPATTNVSETQRFPIVGLGASAGGLEALSSFFANVPEDSGMAYIVVVHMSPKQPTMMPELLRKIAHIPIEVATDGQELRPNHIYVIPPNKEISIYKGKIQLLDIVEKSRALPIDLFFRSLALDQQANAAGIILSGTGTDGTLGIKEIKANDGLVLVQSEESAAYDGMPRSAIATGLVDMVMPPKEMPAKLVHFYTHSNKHPGWKTTTRVDGSTPREQQEWLNKIFAILRTKVGHDFSAYKENTLLRRINRRMGLNQIDSHEKYVRYLRESHREVEALFRELLIGVTSFFRDAESFEILKTDILPARLKKMKEDTTFRVWVPGCSTGEEVYSMAMILRECLDKIAKRINLQLFGTDIDNYAIDKAREGLFPNSIKADVSTERLKRFFTQEGDFYRIRKEVRDCVVFSVQDILKDPPFSRLNLLCCRNLLIYLNTEAQKKILPLFHYTLQSDGILILGSSETIGSSTNLFDDLDKKWKIYKRREVPQAMRQLVDFPRGLSAADQPEGAAPAAVYPMPNIGQITQQAILEQFAPTSILIDSKGVILYIQGRTGKYLETPSGLPTQNLLDLAREGLRIELSSAIRAAKTSNKQVTRKRIAVKTNGDSQMINLHVSPQNAPEELAGRLIVVFEDLEAQLPPAGSEVNAGETSDPVSARIAELENELQITRESHQTTIEELESSNEELKSTNEELQSSNEELQSTNEEMESSKEELQSLNEELQTVNAELQSKVEELSAAHDDMRNLLNSTEVATIFIDNELRVRRFTPEATNIINLIQSDIGRPLRHVVTNLSYEGMIEDVHHVLEKLTPRETEVRTNEGEWYKMRIMPYRTTDNRIDGAVLTFALIEDQKKAEGQAWDLVHTIFDMDPDPMVVLDEDGRIVLVDQAFLKLMKITEESARGMDIFGVKDGLFDHTDLKSHLKTAFNEGKSFRTGAFKISSTEGKGIFAVHGQIIRKENDDPKRILLQLVRQE